MSLKGNSVANTKAQRVPVHRKIDEMVSVRNLYLLCMWVSPNTQHVFIRSAIYRFLSAVTKIYISNGFNSLMK